MATINPIGIKGLRELQSALKDLDGESQKLIRVALNDAAETVAQGARRRMPTKTGKAKSTVRVASTQREAKVKEGSAKAPYVAWLDYGGKVGEGKRVSRPFIREGRYLYPTYSANHASIMNGLEKRLTQLIETAGLGVT